MPFLPARSRPGCARYVPVDVPRNQLDRSKRQGCVIPPRQGMPATAIQPGRSCLVPQDPVSAPNRSGDHGLPFLADDPPPMTDALAPTASPSIALPVSAPHPFQLAFPSRDTLPPMLTRSENLLPALFPAGQTRR